MICTGNCIDSFLLFLFIVTPPFLCSGGAVARGLGDWVASVWLSVVGDRILYILKALLSVRAD